MIIPYKFYLGLTLGSAIIAVVLTIAGLALPTWIQLCDTSRNFFGQNFPFDYGEVCIVRGLFEFGITTEFLGRQTIRLPKEDEISAVEATAALSIIGGIFILVGIGCTCANFFQKVENYDVHKRNLLAALISYTLSTMSLFVAALVYTTTQSSLLRSEKFVQSFFQTFGSLVPQFGSFDTSGIILVNTIRSPEYGPGLALGWVAFAFSLLALLVGVSTLLERNKLKARQSHSAVVFSNNAAE